MHLASAQLQPGGLLGLKLLGGPSICSNDVPPPRMIHISTTSFHVSDFLSQEISSLISIAVLLAFYLSIGGHSIRGS